MRERFSDLVQQIARPRDGTGRPASASWAGPAMADHDPNNLTEGRTPSSNKTGDSIDLLALLQA